MLINHDFASNFHLLKYYVSEGIPCGSCELFQIFSKIHDSKHIFIDYFVCGYSINNHLVWLAEFHVPKNILLDPFDHSSANILGEAKQLCVWLYRIYMFLNLQRITNF